MNSSGVWNQKSKKKWGDGLAGGVFAEGSGRQSRGQGLAVK